MIKCKSRFHFSEKENHKFSIKMKNKKKRNKNKITENLLIENSSILISGIYLSFLFFFGLPGISVSHGGQRHRILALAEPCSWDVGTAPAQPAAAPGTIFSKPQGAVVASELCHGWSPGQQFLKCVFLWYDVSCAPSTFSWLLPIFQARLCILLGFTHQVTGPEQGAE